MKSVNAAPVAALRRIREVLRIIREPFRLHLRPTMDLDQLECRPYGLDIEHGLARVGREDGCNLGRRSHSRDRLSRKYKLADVNRNALHPGDQHMIPATGVEDQELSVAAKRPGVNNPSITRGCYLGADPGCQGNAFFYAPCAVGTAKIANPGAVNRQRK